MVNKTATATILHILEKKVICCIQIVCKVEADKQWIHQMRIQRVSCKTKDSLSSVLFLGVQGELFAHFRFFLQAAFVGSRSECSLTGLSIPFFLLG